MIRIVFEVLTLLHHSLSDLTEATHWFRRSLLHVVLQELESERDLLNSSQTVTEACYLTP
jgi:hypothetical protein